MNYFTLKAWDIIVFLAFKVTVTVIMPIAKSDTC